MKPYHITKSYIKHVTLTVTNLDVSEDFYNNVIMLDTLSKKEDTVVLGSNGVPLVILTQSNAKKVVQEGLYHIAFLLKDETQLANWTRVNQNHLYYMGASHHGVSKAMYLSDPDGHGIEVYADVDDSKWVSNGSEIEMYTRHLNIEELINNSNNETNFDFIIGHLHLQTKNVEATANFYKNLGFELTFDMTSAKFMSFNQYHHHIAFNQWNQFAMGHHVSNSIDIQNYEIWYESKELFDKVKHNLISSKITYQQDGDFIIVKDPLNINIKLTY